MIVVGIDGSSAAWQALDWGAAEAERTDQPLTIVHAGDRDQDGSEAGDFAHELLADAVARLAESHPTVTEHTESRAGGAGYLLIELSAGADLLVVGQAGAGRVASLLIGTTVQYVLAHARCPVVVVSEQPPTSGGPVVVGVSTSEGGLAAMRFAFAEAHGRATSVLAVRSWSDPVWVLVGVRTPITTYADWHEVEQALLDRWLASARAEFPDVEIRSELSSKPVYWELERYADSAALLVLGCRRGDSAHFARLGPIATWAVRIARCPVAVVGHSSGLVDTKPEQLGVAYVANA